MGRLPGYVLRFHKCGTDGSGKCNTVDRRDEADAVHGVLYEIREEDKQRLDGVEHGYEVKSVTVRSQTGRPVTAFTYVAVPEDIDDSLMPFLWYRDLVVAGAVEHALPAEYVEMLKSIRGIVDSDRQRERREREALRLP